MYSLKYFLFYEIDVYLNNGATDKLSVSGSNPGSLCKTRWQQWCYWCQNRGDKAMISWYMVLFMILQKLLLIYSEILAMTSGVLAETTIESLVLASFTMYTIFFHEGFWT